jgi:hypothetical protein
MSTKDLEIMKIVECKSLEELTTDSQLITYWTGSSNNLMNISDVLNDSYKENSKNKLENCINQYETLINCVSKLNAAFHYKYINERDIDKKNKFYSLAAYTQIHIERLQHQCNQLIYRTQQKENKLYFCSGIAIAIVIAIISFLIPIYYGEKQDTIVTTKASCQPLEKKFICCLKNTCHLIEKIDTALSNKYLSQHADTIKSSSSK